MGERAELMASISAASYLTKHGGGVDFYIELKFLEAIQEATESLKLSKKPEDRVTRVRLLELVDEYNEKIELFVEAARLMFQKPIRDYITSGYDLLETLEGLSLRVFGPRIAGTSPDWHPIDVYRK